MNCYVINLEKEKERRKAISSRLKQLGINFEIINAVNGAALTEQQKEEWAVMDIIRANAKFWSDGLIACSLSHYFLYKRIAEEPHHCALILEDDATLDNELPGILKKIEEVILPDEVYMLFFTSWSPCLLSKKGIVNLNGQFSAYYPVDIKDPITTTGYVIGKEAAKKLADTIFPIYLAPDSWKIFYELGTFSSLRCVYPRPVNTADFKSSIDYIERNSLKGQILDAINRFRIPPFYQLLKLRRRNKKEKKLKVLFSDEVGFNQRNVDLKAD